MEEDATRETVYSVIKQADEDKSGPLDLPAIVERCNVALLGKRKKLSDKEANGHIRRLVKAQKIVLVKQAQKGTYYSTEAPAPEKPKKVAPAPQKGPTQTSPTPPAPKDPPKSTISKKMRSLPTGISEILPGFLYLGSGRDARDEEELHRWKISHILNVASDWPKHAMTDKQGRELQYLQVPLEDRYSENISWALDRAFEFIEEARGIQKQERETKEKEKEEKEEKEKEEDESEGEEKRVEAEGRVLVHCAVGKSRSPTIVMAYLMKHHNMSLKDAYNLVMQKRRLPGLNVCPNNSFMRQLMAYEVTLSQEKLQDKELFEENECRYPSDDVGGCSLHWDEISTEVTSLEPWLEASNVLGKKHYEDAKPSHMWWGLTSKPQYLILPEKRAEFFSEYAKAYLRGERLQLVEYRSEPLFKLFIDLDIKCQLDDVDNPPTPTEILKPFLKGIAEVTIRYLEEGEAGTKTKKGAEEEREKEKETKPKEEEEGRAEHQETKKQRIEELNKKAVIAISGTGSKFTHAIHRNVNYKFGYHLIFPSISVEVSQQKRYVRELIEHFKPLWPVEEEATALKEDVVEEEEEGNQPKGRRGRAKEAAKHKEQEKKANKKRRTNNKKGGGGIIPDSIIENNLLEELFDMPENLRMLYSAKMLECKRCKSLKRTQKKKSNTKKGRGGGGGGSAASGAPGCSECNGSGLRELRLYEFMGIYWCVNDSWDADVPPRSDVAGVRRQVDLCSITK